MPYAWLTPDEIQPALATMVTRRVSLVARSRSGFLHRYLRVSRDRLGNSPRGEPWVRRRENFVKRHMAQVRQRGESLWEENGQPTRRHLALIAWAYTPTPGRYRRWAASQ